mmetsp:Transcript_16628/g.34116  ORF Transcript_16628/g.34116 Transcript_16628/m.34116 type:complete len:125 (+) Transcript_16628:207-581(+)
MMMTRGAKGKKKAVNTKRSGFIRVASVRILTSSRRQTRFAAFILPLRFPTNLECPSVVAETRKHNSAVQEMVGSLDFGQRASSCCCERFTLWERQSRVTMADSGGSGPGEARRGSPVSQSRQSQ